MIVSDIKYLVGVINDKRGRLLKTKIRLEGGIELNESQYTVSYCRNELITVNYELEILSRCINIIADL